MSKVQNFFQALGFNMASKKKPTNETVLTITVKIDPSKYAFPIEGTLKSMGEAIKGTAPPGATVTYKVAAK